MRRIKCRYKFCFSSAGRTHGRPFGSPGTSRSMNRGLLANPVGPLVSPTLASSTVRPPPLASAPRSTLPPPGRFKRHGLPTPTSPPLSLSFLSPHLVHLNPTSPYHFQNSPPTQSLNSSFSLSLSFPLPHTYASLSLSLFLSPFFSFARLTLPPPPRATSPLPLRYRITIVTTSSFTLYHHLYHHHHYHHYHHLLLLLHRQPLRLPRPSRHARSLARDSPPPVP